MAKTAGKNFDKEDKNETKVHTLDSQPEQDGKGEIASEGVKSDEGFSEASEELAVKGQQFSPLKLKCDNLSDRNNQGKPILFF